MLITLLAVVFVLGVAIVVHEFGHFIVAKKAGIFVKTFSVGFGRKLLKRRYGETIYTISLIPFGGYVKFAGEMEGEEQSEAPQGDPGDETPDSEIDPARYFVNKSLLARGAVVFAGPFFNYVLAIILYIGMLAFDGVSVVPTARLGSVDANSPAAESGLLRDDVIQSVDGQPVETWSELVNAVLEGEGPKRLLVQRGVETLELDYEADRTGEVPVLGFDHFVSNEVGLVKRDGPAYRSGLRNGATIVAINDTLTTSFSDIERIIHANPEVPLAIHWTLDGAQRVDTITPEAKKVPLEGSMTEFRVVGQIGIGPAYDKRRLPIHEAVGYGFTLANNMVVTIVTFLAHALQQLFTGNAGQVADSLGGPILIGQMAGDMARWGFDRLIYFLAFLSINLGIFNLLPVLPFDGGHLALFMVEGVTRRKLHPKLRERMAQAGFVLLILLMAVVISLDLVRCTGSSPGFF